MDILRYSVFFVFNTIITVYDLRYYRIPDVLVAGCFSLILSIDISFFYFSIIKNLVSALIMFFLLSMVYLFKEGIGFGDVKLAALTAYVLGFYESIFALLTACLAGIFFCLIKTYLFKENDKKIAFAPFILFGALAVVISRFLLNEIL